MKNYSLLKRLFWMAAAVLALPFSAFSMHIIGGEMTYRFIDSIAPGVNRYEIKMLVYRDADANGANLDANAPFGIFRGSMQSATLIDEISVPLDGPFDVAPAIPPCADVSQITNAQVERGIYIFTVDLPVLINESYLIVYQRCCRTNFITNIKTPGQFGSTYVVELTPLAQKLRNSSPVFSDPPPTFICSLLPLSFDHSAFDVDGDSLVYSFCNPLHGGASGQGGGGPCATPSPNPPCGPPFATVPFLAPYTFLDPMGGSPSINIDPVSGLLSGKPTMLGQFVVGICIQEYRNGVLLGQVFRDFQFNVVDCTPFVQAKIEGNAPGQDQNFFLLRCGDKKIKIKNETAVNPFLETYEWEWIFGQNDTLRVPTFDFEYEFPDFGLYRGALYLNRLLDCRDTAWIELEVRPGVTADFDLKWDTCAATAIAFFDSTKVGGANTVEKWEWSFASVAASDLQNPTYLPPNYGIYPTKLKVTDSDGCTSEKFKTVDWQPQLLPKIEAFALIEKCLPGVVEIPLFDSAVDLSNCRIVWDFGDGETLDSNLTRPVHEYFLPDFYSPKVWITSPFDCFASDSFPRKVAIYASPEALFSYSPKKPSNLDPEVFFDDQSAGAVVKWDWRFGDGGSSDWPDAIHYFQDTGRTTAFLRVETQDGCADSVSQTLDITPLVRLFLPNAFRPSDGNNAFGNGFFGPLGILPAYKKYKMAVFGRWGELLFESDDPADQWDGRRKTDGKMMPTGVYVYFLHFEGPRGEPFDFEGSVTLF